MQLSPKARRAALELQEAILEGRTRDVVELVRAYRLSAGDRIAVVQELDRPTVSPDAEFVLAYDGYDRASVGPPRAA